MTGDACLAHGTRVFDVDLVAGHRHLEPLALAIEAAGEIALDELRGHAASDLSVGCELQREGEVAAEFGVKDRCFPRAGDWIIACRSLWLSRWRCLDGRLS